MASLRVTLVSAEQEIFKGQARFVVLPGMTGELGVLPGHQALLTRIRAGTVRLDAPPGEPAFFYVTGGFAEIQPDAVIVLADTALRAHTLDEAKAARARAQALEMRQQSNRSIDFVRAHQELVMASARVAALRKSGAIRG